MIPLAPILSAKALRPIPPGGAICIPVWGRVKHAEIPIRSGIQPLELREG